MTIFKKITKAKPPILGGHRNWQLRSDEQAKGRQVSAYYNEIDPFTASWLKELIKAGHIAPGVVDERSIEDVIPSDLDGFEQCHFFAGIGIWSFALRLAGWPDDRPVWTGSCPCQPFSAAGKGKGFADERHLWPAFYHLIRQRRPCTIFGEQVASTDGLAWFDLVQTDMEAAHYACAAVDTCAAGYGAPHIRQRLYWIATTYNNDVRMDNSISKRLEGQSRNGDNKPKREKQAGLSPQTSHPCRVENAFSIGWSWWRDGDSARIHRSLQIEGCEPARGLANSACREVVQECQKPHKIEGEWPLHIPPRCGMAGEDSHAINNFWKAADWLFCRDGKWRPVEPGSCALADGITGRVGRLRGYGNALVAPQAEAFIRACMELMVD